jgi:uncharacterized SAM-binding protein YcdF (DUF218 family)
LIVVFGAAVRPDGSPSPTLARRIAFAAAAAARYVDADLFCSGAKGTHGPSEASVMADVLAETVDRSRIHLDETSVDTLQSVVAATAFARAGKYAQCMICTDGYHQPRIRMLFAMLGMPASAIHVPHGGSRRYQLKMRTREAAAIPYDLATEAGAARLAFSCERRSPGYQARYLANPGFLRSQENGSAVPITLSVTPDLFRGPRFRKPTAMKCAERWMPEQARHDGAR